MRYSFYYLLKATLLVLIIFSCQKEASFEPRTESKGSLTADLTGNCQASVVNGVYSAGNSLTAANYIEIQVNVTTPGTYSIQSDTVNGFFFKGNGNADSIGIRTVRLSGYGKPMIAGFNSFDIKYGNTICAIDVEVNGTSTSNAVYTLTNSGGACPTVTFKGTYTAGVALNNTNSIEFDVNVTQPGAYALNVATINGISFSGSGIFSAGGTQKVVLKGSGTPTTSGTFNSTITNGTASCTFSIVVAPAASTPDATYTINCANVQLAGTYIKGVAMSSANTAKISAIVSAAGKYTITTTAVNGITFTGTGNFGAASTTPQTVTLTATGTPVNQGTFTYPVTGNGSSCNFPVVFANTAALAVFTLSGAPNACSTPVINGSYNTGAALSTSNSVTLNVNVATAGTYNVTTNTVNGMKFAGSGNFANTGAQTIVLIGSGIPVAAGVHTFSPQVGTSSCTFNVTVVTTTVAAGTFSCKIDGVFTTFNDRAEAEHEPDPFFGGGIDLHLDGYTTPPNGAEVPHLQIFINNNDGSAIKAGTYNEKGMQSANGYRIEVDYHAVDSNGDVVIWNTSSNFLSVNPPFTITVTSITSSRVKGTFSGKVTNIFQNSTSTKTITEGVFDLPIQ